MQLLNVLNQLNVDIHYFYLRWVWWFVHPYANWTWVALGILPLLVFVPSWRLATLCPNEQSLWLWPLRQLGKVTMMAPVAFSGAVLVMTVWAHDYALTYFQWAYPERLHPGYAEQIVHTFWIFVLAQLHLVGYGALTGLVIGIGLLMLLVRYGEPAMIAWLRRSTRYTTRDTQTDARTVAQQFRTPPKVDANKFIKKAFPQDAVFFGLDMYGKPIFIPRDHWKESNVEVMGLPGAGKGVQAGIVLTQSIAYGDGVYAFDPKYQGDAWAPSVYAHACREAGKSMLKVDLTGTVPRINPLAGISSTNLEALLIGALGLGHTHGIDDVYRGEDRKAVAKLATLADAGPVCLASLADRAHEVLDESEIKAARKFLNGLDELARIPSVQTLDGINLMQPIEHGGLLYFTGSTTHAGVVLLQRLIFLRVMQLIEQRPLDHARHITLFADEFKHHLTPHALTALGTLRDRHANIILTHQSLGDFGELPQLTADQVKTTITDTCGIKWFYRAMDEQNARWIAGHTGTILVERDRRTAESNEAGGEHVSGRRSVEQVPRYLIDVNMVQHLPKYCAVCVGVGQAHLAFARPLTVTKCTFNPKAFTRYERAQSAGDWLQSPLPNDDGTDTGGALL